MICPPYHPWSCWLAEHGDSTLIFHVFFLETNYFGYLYLWKPPSPKIHQELVQTFLQFYGFADIDSPKRVIRASGEAQKVDAPYFAQLVPETPISLCFMVDISNYFPWFINQQNCGSPACREWDSPPISMRFTGIWSWSMIASRWYDSNHRFMVEMMLDLSNWLGLY